MLHQFPVQPEAGGSAQIPPSSRNLAYTRFRLKGDAPFYNDWGSSEVDHRREKVYMYGGVRPHDESNTPTSDFSCLDIKTMQWWNLTNSLKFRPRNHIFDPFWKEPENLEVRPLPALTEASTALISVGGGTFFMIFGGHNGQNPTSDLVAVDLDSLVWWFVEVGGTPLRPRMGASMVAVNSRLFIFGGRDQFVDNSPPIIRTYSIAEYNPQTRWTWRLSDSPLPPNLPLLGYAVQATPIYGGQKILLTQGRIHNDKPIDMSRESTIFFHTENHTFQDAGATMGTFPSGIAWYQLGSFVAGQHPPAASSPRKRGRPPKNPRPESPAPIAVMPTHGFPPSAVIVGWVPHGIADGDLVPEFWQYSLPPAERIRCLDLREKLWDLNLDLQEFVGVGNRLFLLGNQDGRESSDTENNQIAVDKPLPRWDVAIEISSEYLKR
ncbi:hypothetical protein DFH06DRAFT_1319837 [Mycena polygramma]|nr:hypothetical protein DFH06DRAFT_1319837 [Mycena polygramma]